MLYDKDQRVSGFPEIAILSNEKVDGKFIGVVAAGDFWHSDQSYRRETSLATLAGVTGSSSRSGRLLYLGVDPASVAYL